MNKYKEEMKEMNVIYIHPTRFTVFQMCLIMISNKVLLKLNIWNCLMNTTTKYQVLNLPNFDVQI